MAELRLSKSMKRFQDERSRSQEDTVHLEGIEAVIQHYLKEKYVTRKGIEEAMLEVGELIEDTEKLTEESDLIQLAALVSGMMNLMSEIDELFRSGALPQRDKEYYDANPNIAKKHGITNGTLKGRRSQEYVLTPDEVQAATAYSEALVRFFAILNEAKTQIFNKLVKNRQSQ